MMYVRLISFLVLIVSLTSTLNAQTTRKIFFGKDKALIYFFQVEKKSDTIRKGRADRFVLLVPDSLKDNVRIDIDNAKLDKTENDSLVLLTYLPGLRYEAAFIRPNSPIGSPVEKHALKVFVNGVAQTERGIIRVQFVDRRNNKTVLENRFFSE